MPSGRMGQETFAPAVGAFHSPTAIRRSSSFLLNSFHGKRVGRMTSSLLGGATLGLALCTSLAADFTPAAQQFQQEVAQHFTVRDGAPTGPVQLVECMPGGTTRAFAAGKWYEFRCGRWN